MNECEVLLEINNLEKLITREFIQHANLNDKILTPPTQSQMKILSYILKNKDKEIYQNDLEEVLGLRRATVSGVLQTMEKHGLIKRITSNKDARIKQIILNDNALKLFDEGKNRFLNLEKKVKEEISEDELLSFLKVIRKMQQNIINISNEK